MLQWIGSLFFGDISGANGTSQHVPVVSAEPVDAVLEVSGVNHEGICFANLVRQILPFVSQVENQLENTREASNSAPSQADAISVSLDTEYSY